MKTSELIGPALDWAVAKCENRSEIKIFAKHRPSDRGWIEVRFNPEPKATTARFDPSENWSQGGPIIEREWINVVKSVDGLQWEAASERWMLEDGHPSYGPTPLIAAMRAYVASKLGDEVEIPKELYEPS